MVDFRIDVVIDPAQSAGGAKRVQQQLTGLQTEAAALRKALTDALAIRDAGTTAALGRIETILGRTEEQALITGARIGQIGRDINDRGVRKLNDELDKTAMKASSVGQLLRTAFAGVSAALVAREFIQLSDAVTNTQNRLRLVTSSSAELADVQQRLFDISNATRSSFTSTAEVFNRVALSAKELGVSNERLLDFTQSLNQAVVLSGASASEASAGLIQLSQGLASGALRGDELRSVLEQLPAVADVIAKSLGVTRGELRQLGQDGKITAQVVLDAFAKARTELNDRFATTLPTIGQAFTVLGTKATEAVARVNELTGASTKFAQVLIFLAENVGPQEDFGKALEEAGTAANSLGAQITSARRELALLNTISERSGGLSESQAARVKELTDRIAEYTNASRTSREATERDNAAKAAAEAIAAANAATAKQEADDLKRRGELLASIQKPQQDYLQLQRDLGVLLEQNRITQQQYNEELARAKPAAAKVDASGFEKELAAIREQNVELLIRAKNSGLQEEALLIENELRQQGVELTREQQLALAAELIKRRELTETVKTQADNEKKLAEAAQARESRLDRLQQEIEGNDRIAVQIADLIALRKREGVAVDLVDQRISQLRLRQLEAANDLGSGFERAFLKIKAEAEDLAAVGEQVVNVFANTAADAITTFVTTGKLNFKEFATSILADITRIIARLLVVQAINAVVGAVSGTGNLGGVANQAVDTGLNAGRAGGGTVQPGQRAFPVGEQGPELFVPRQTGTIVPNPQSTPAAPPQVTVQVVNVTDPTAVPSAINDGLADESIVNVLNRKREAVRQLLS